jgi:hypothetical protein
MLSGIGVFAVFVSMLAQRRLQRVNILQYGKLRGTEITIVQVRWGQLILYDLQASFLCYRVCKRLWIFDWNEICHLMTKQ